MSAAAEGNVKVRGKNRVRKVGRLLFGGLATALLVVGATVAAGHPGSASTAQRSRAADRGANLPASQPAPRRLAPSGKATPADAKLIPTSGPSSQSFDYSFLTPSTGNLLSNINAAVDETGDIVSRIDNGQQLTDKEYDDAKAAYEHPVDYDLQENLRNDIDRIDHSVYNSQEPITYGQTQVDGNGDVWFDGPSGWWSPNSSLTTPPFLFADALPQAQSVAH